MDRKLHSMKKTHRIGLVSSCSYRPRTFLLVCNSLALFFSKIYNGLGFCCRYLSSSFFTILFNQHFSSSFLSLFQYTHTRTPSQFTSSSNGAKECDITCITWQPLANLLLFSFAKIFIINILKYC